MKASWLLFIGILVGVSGCVTTTVEPEIPSLPIATITSGDLSFIPNSATRYAWHPQSGNNFLDDSYNEQSIDAHLLQSIRTKLAYKGYQEVLLSQNPDFLIGYGVAIESQLSDVALFAKTLLNTGINIDGSEEIEGVQVEKGTVLLALFSANPDMQSRWVAMSQGPVSPEYEENGLMQDRIESMLRHLNSMPDAAQ